MFIMKLKPEFFDQVKSGKKIYEVRIYDEKRQKVAIGDNIIFKREPDLIDGVIVLLGAILIKSNAVTTGIDYTMILYAVLFIYLSGLVMDQIVFSGFNSRAVYIISDKNEEIKQKILEDFERGVTQIRVVGGYTNSEKTKLVCVLSSNEFYKLKGIVHEIDPKAFFYAVRASEVFGEGFTDHHEGN